MANLSGLRDFVVAATRIVAGAPRNEAAQIIGLRPMLARLVALDDWLPEEYATPDPQNYRQYLLHADALSRFSVISSVCGRGQSTPVCDLRLWSLVGVLRGAELATPFSTSRGGAMISGPTERRERGDVFALPAKSSGAQAVSNAYDDRVSISIHVYGGNIGSTERSAFDLANGAQYAFVSGYANASLPNLWNVGKAA